jgi:hypothetical protein
MAYRQYYMSSYTSSVRVDNPAYACDTTTGEYASSQYKASPPYSCSMVLSSITCPTTNYGTISSVVAYPYWYGYGGGHDSKSLKPIWSGTLGYNFSSTSSGWSAPGYELVGTLNAPSPMLWSSVNGLTFSWIGTSLDPSMAAGQLDLARILIYVYYTPVASTASWSTPSAGSTHYRAGSGVYISGTAANANGVYSVEYKIDSGSWVLCTGTTSWSATIPQSSLTHGSHTLTLRVRDSSTDYAYTTIGTTRTIIQSPLPAQTI